MVVAEVAFANRFKGTVGTRVRLKDSCLTKRHSTREITTWTCAFVCMRLFAYVYIFLRIHVLLRIYLQPGIYRQPGRLWSVG